jgi:hypothetical protein
MLIDIMSTKINSSMNPIFRQVMPILHTVRHPFMRQFDSFLRM